MPAKPLQYSPFFKAVKHPRDWGFIEYLKFDHGKLTPRKIVDGWRKSLESITRSTGKEFSQSQRKHAAVLLKRYKEKGKGSDSAYGREWLAEKTKQQKTSAVHIGAVFQGPVSNSLVPIGQASGSDLIQVNSVDSSKDADLVTLVEDSDSEDDGTESPVPDEAHTSTPLSFRNSYNDMREECKWVLASGRIVEDIIFDACQAMDVESFKNSLAQSFVLDTSDTVMKGWFADDEWKEIVGSVLLLPKPDVVLADSMKRFFQIKSTATLREALDKHGYLPEGVGYDPEVHFNSQWADVVIRRFLMLLEAPGEPLRMSHLEDWYSSYIWSSILDDCLLNLGGMTMERKESPCRATSIRKNRNRVRINRMKIGSRLDGIIRTVEDDYYEYGAVEVARTFNGVTSTKWLGDFFKLAKALRDMLLRLHELVGNDQLMVKRLQVVGVATAGLSFQYLRMNHPSGYVCLLQREKLQQVPKAVHELPDLLHLLMNVAQMKQVIRDCAAAVEERHVAKTESDLYEELIGGNAGEQGRLGWALDTP